MNSTYTTDRRSGVIVPLMGTKDVGNLYATKVRILSGAYAEQRAIVVRIDHSASVRVRFDSGLELAFGPSEMEAI